RERRNLHAALLSQQRHDALASAAGIAAGRQCFSFSHVSLIPGTTCVAGAPGSGSMASSRAETTASATPASLYPDGTAPSNAMESSAVMSGAPALASGATTMALP